MDEFTCKKNTNKELWREKPGDYYSPFLFVTEAGGIGISVGGLVFVKPIRDWHMLAKEDSNWGTSNYKVEE